MTGQREIGTDNIYELESLDELRQFDVYFVQNAHSSILKNICKVLNCKEIDVHNFRPIKQGLTNKSFVFEVFGKEYVYRHPGEGTEYIINRRHEKKALEIANTLGIEPTYIYSDAKEGWKISHYVSSFRMPDYSNFEDSKRVIGTLKKLHNSGINVDWEFLPWEEACRIEEKLKKSCGISLNGFEILKENVEKCYRIAQKDCIEKRFCHCDTYAPNWMLTENEAILIDWEYSGNADPGCDVGGYIMDAMYSIEEAETFIREYIEDDKLLLHYMAYVAIISYYWFVWALYRESCGGDMGESLHNWYVMAKRYSNYLVKIMLN